MSRASSLPLGLLAGGLSVLIGVGWQVATRLGTTTTLAPIDLALFRYGVPALALAPLWLRSGLLPAGVARGAVALMVLGAGLPFGLAAMAGAAFAPTAHMAVLLPGTMPLFVALLAWAVLGERPVPRRFVGLGLILVGIVAIGLPALADRSDGAWRGDLLFLAAALLWAVYTVAYRRSRMAPWTSAAVVAGWSGLAVGPVWLLAGEGRLATAPLADVALQFVMQGLVAGLGGLGIYALAVRHLGATRAAASGALVPPAAALAGWLVLGERPDGATLLGAVAATLGVALAATPGRDQPPAPKLRPGMESSSARV
ncbi:DMT family transporter [Stella sp.]|uniref:DMT family transporter n=1 Tax=Stella sp. TaxID=2912054 RepID=UPI0035B4B5C3